MWSCYEEPSADHAATVLEILAQTSHLPVEPYTISKNAKSRSRHGHRDDDFLGRSSGSLKLFLLPFPLAFPFIASFGGLSSSSLAKSSKPNPTFDSSSKACMRPSLSLPLTKPLLPMLLLCGSKLLLACMLLLVSVPEMISVAIPSLLAPLINLCPSGSDRDMLSR